MADHSKIERTDATWNPITGCSVVSAGCTNCYAMVLAGTRLRNHPSRAGLTTDTKAGPVWNGQVRLNEAWLTQPLQWRQPRRIFVCAHGDLFHEDVPDEWIDRVVAVMALAPQHTFQVLTKRSGRMRAYFEARRDGDPWAEAADAIGDILGMQDAHSIVLEPSDIPLKNVWLGVSTEDQRRADERVPDLLATPAAVRFVSAEPLLGQLDFTPWLHDSTCLEFDGPWCTCSEPREVHLDWIIVGGESGPNARPMHPAWARAIRDQCAAAEVPFHFKQWGAWLPGQNDVHDGFGDDRKVAHWQDDTWGACDAPLPVERNYVMWESDGTPHAGGSRIGRHIEVAAWATRVGKARAGRLLDGVEHNGMPEVAHG